MKLVGDVWRPKALLKYLNKDEQSYFYRKCMI